MKPVIRAGTMLLLLLLAFVTRGATHPSALGEEVTFAGRVLNDASGDPVTGAQVSIPGTRLGTVTGSAGEYALTVPRDVVPATGVTLRVMRLGFQVAEFVVVADDAFVSTDLRIKPTVLALQEIVATGQVDPVTGVRSPMEVRASVAAVGSGAAVGSTDFRDRIGALPPPPDRDWNREQYDHIVENVFLDPIGNPLSTFSIDVDRASYSNVRRFLHEGRLPPVDAVRLEELVNYFPYEYERPEGDEPFAVTTELGRAPWRDGHLLLRIGIASPAIETESLPPNNLVFLLDVSGSMNSPDKLPLVKRSLRLLVNELRPDDRVAIVVYAGAAGLVLPSTPGARKSEILEAIERMEAGGSTAGGAGLRLAYEVAREYHMESGNNRIILATDGDFNVGESSDSEMIRLVEERRSQGTYLTVLGFGTGNLQSEKMQKLAQHGNGNYAYIDSLLEARKVLVSEMGGTLLTVAQDVKLQIEFNPERVQGYRLIGYENRLLAAEDFNDDARDAGELGAGHTVTALYEIVPVGVESEVEIGGTDPLRYRDPASVARTSEGAEVAFVRVRYKLPGEDESSLLEHPVGPRVSRPSADFNFAAAVAGFGMILRDSEHRGSATSDQLLTLARNGLGEDRDGYRVEFVRVMERYQVIAGEREAGPDEPSGRF
ncbi:MAG: von Willebrand factor type A domain-containing protein [Gemmatimonadota bacterium]